MHVTLLDMHGAYSGRVDGGVGFPLTGPRVSLSLKKRLDDSLLVQFSEEGKDGAEFRPQLIDCLKRLQQEKKLGGVTLTFLEAMPLHAGFGAKTQTLLAATCGYSQLYDLQLEPQELARHVKRGGTSGIGVASFFQGGLIIDAGHRFSDKGNSFKPSSFSHQISPPPLVGRYKMPEWPVLIALPGNRKQIHGELEQALFQEVCPVPLADVQSCAHIILCMMIPAVAEKDLPTFCVSINRLQELRWKSFEIDAQSKEVRGLMNYLRSIGLAGVGMSSWGAAVFALGEKLIVEPEKILTQTNAWLKEHGGGQCFITKMKNEGAEIEIMP